MGVENSSWLNEEGGKRKEGGVSIRSLISMIGNLQRGLHSLSSSWAGASEVGGVIVANLPAQLRTHAGFTKGSIVDVPQLRYEVAVNGTGTWHLSPATLRSLFPGLQGHW